MLNASMLQFLFQLAKGIAQQFGPNCEVVVHDLISNDPDSSIVAIENGHVTGRKVGDGPSHVVLEALRSERANLQDHLSYLTRTKDGKILKSSTFYIRDDDGNAVGIFGINYDITLMLAMENSLKQFTSTEQENQEPEEISRNVSDLLDEADPIEGSYVLEVSSAGADRPLKKPAHFQQFLGAEVDVRLYRPLDGRKEYTGVLKGYDGGDVTIETAGEARTFVKKDVAQVRLTVHF